MTEMCEMKFLVCERTLPNGNLGARDGGRIMELRGQVRSQMEFGNEGTGTSFLYVRTVWLPLVAFGDPDIK